MNFITRLVVISFVCLCASAANYHVGMPIMSFEYSEEPILYIESGPELPLNSTAHSTVTRPNRHNISATFECTPNRYQSYTMRSFSISGSNQMHTHQSCAPRLTKCVNIDVSSINCNMDSSSINGSIAFFTFENWASCLNHGFMYYYLIRRVADLGAVAAVFEVRIDLPIWILQASPIFLEGVDIPVIWVDGRVGNVSSILKASASQRRTATLLPPGGGESFFSQIEKMSQVSTAYIKFGIFLWVALFLGTLATLVLRTRAEARMNSHAKKRATPTGLLRLALFFIMVLSVTRLVEKSDPSSSHGRVSRGWALSSTLNFQGTSLASVVMCISAWWAMIVSAQSNVRFAASPKRFHLIASISLIIVWIACIVNFVVDSVISFPPLIWSSVVVFFLAASAISCLVFGTLFILQLKKSRDFEKKNSVFTKNAPGGGPRGSTFFCCGRIRLSRIEFVLLRMGSFVIVIFIISIGFVPLFVLSAATEMPYVLIFLLYDILCIVACTFVNLMVFVAPKSQPKPTKEVSRANRSGSAEGGELVSVSVSD